MKNPNHISPGESGSSGYYSKIRERWITYTWEKDFILPDLSDDECLLEEDIISEIKEHSREEQIL